MKTTEHRETDNKLSESGNQGRINWIDIFYASVNSTCAQPHPRDRQGGKMPRSSRGGWVQVELTDALTENRFLFIECKERSIGCTRALMFILTTQRPSSCKQCEKNVNEWCMLFVVTLVVYCLYRLLKWCFKMTCILAQMKVDFSLWYAEWRIGMPKNIIQWRWKGKTRYWKSHLWANVRFFALMNVSSRYWSPFHANECVFWRNEQQKMYLVVKGL